MHVGLHGRELDAHVCSESDDDQLLRLHFTQQQIERRCEERGVPRLQNGQVFRLRCKEARNLAALTGQREASAQHIAELRMPCTVVVVRVDGRHAMVGELALEACGGLCRA